jgi:CubicO group peptidase (beta-lactamase class C family)
VVSRISKGGVAWTKAFGRANLSTGTLMQTNMVFNHGSNGKLLTLWGILRLVEQGRVELDAPVNRYLKRWQLRSTHFDPAGVTIRRCLSHTAGLSVHGFLDYDQRRPLPSLVEMLEGRNQIPILNGEGNGPVFIKWQPGSKDAYSGGGYVILQMVIEDITGQSFAQFMHREVTAPLGLDRLEWVWTRELERLAPMTYGEMQEEIGYRQLGCQAIGSEICTVPDFAHFVSAMVPGPQGEPPGRGVLKPETVTMILEPLPGGIGFGYSVTNMQRNGFPADLLADRFVSHSGANPGWTAFFQLDATKREGFVVANNSALGNALNVAVQRIWLNTALGMDAGTDPPPGATLTVSLNDTAFRIAAAIWVFLLAATGWCASQIARGRRSRSGTSTRRSLLILAPPVLLTLVWWYVSFAPHNMPLPLPTTFLSIWRMPLINYIAALLLGWLGVAILFTLFPRTRRMAKSNSMAQQTRCSEPGDGALVDNRRSAAPGR